MFRYNSYHKIILGGFIVLWAIFHFYSRQPENNYSNGQNKRIGNIENGKNEGMWTWYYPNGKKRIQGTFVEGKREGIWTTWNEAQIVVQVCEYHNDKLNGALVTYSEQGEKMSTVKYVNDVRIN